MVLLRHTGIVIDAGGMNNNLKGYIDQVIKSKLMTFVQKNDFILFRKFYILDGRQKKIGMNEMFFS